ncbi:YdeI/OmpD-associated family protein [Armatimonas rosea]|uniref:EF-hand domain-containing protein n=1 Tax=Armatimonas rosea TaxID=685828 RepID=A0A7W9SVI9_ARMRO|nr:YdeI/OmpD-associated family protein [Armatimonas rosea]MBB6053636.1 hypothetical protein [Armatimonas rosea]
MSEPEPHALFKALDTNNDGKLSRDEIPEILRPAFDKMDTDGDGFITVTEEAAARSAADAVLIEATPLQRYTTKLSIRGKSVALPIPFDPDDTWGQKERHDVAGTVDGHTIRGVLKADRDGVVLPLGPTWLKDAGLVVSEATEVEVELSPEGPQLDNLAADFREALLANPEACAYFQAIPTFHRKNYVRWIDDAKRPETRTKRISEAIVLLNAKQRR